MLGRAAGHTVGLSKNVSPVIVRVPKFTHNVEYYLEGLAKITDETAGHGKRAGSAVRILSMSLYWPRKDNGKPTFINKDGSDGYEYIRGVMRGLLRLLVSQNVLPIVASGNDGDVTLRSP